MAQPPRVNLVPVDFSDVSHRALEHAKITATAPGARIVLLHVVNPMPPGVGVDVTATMPPIDVDAESQAAKKSLVGWSKAVPGSTTAVRIGAPADEILSAA